MKFRFGLTVGSLAAACSLLAQPGERVVHDVVVATNQTGPEPQTFHFISAGEFMAGAVIKGQPYSAEATTEMIRVLADGTRVTNKSTSSLARDKEGRTRRENTFNSVGPWATAGHPAPHMVTITDPVTKDVRLLDMNARTYRKVQGGQASAFRSRSASADGKEVFEQRVEVMVKERKGENRMEAGMVMAAPVAGATMAFHRFNSKDAKKESLGRQNMEGVMVDGTRETITIPAGEIGNDRPIVSVTERWYSPELQMEIYTKTTDPQFGESTYRVTNLRRAEPDAELFRVPADFKAASDRIIPSSRIMRKGLE